MSYGLRMEDAAVVDGHRSAYGRGDRTLRSPTYGVAVPAPPALGPASRAGR